MKLEAGERLAIDTQGAVSRAAARREFATQPEPAEARPTTQADRAPAALPTPDERWAAAQHALESGDRTLAERQVGQLLDEIGEAHAIHGRASFFLAELLLARGASSAARARLSPLVPGSDPALGQDAATLLARSYSTHAERAQVWSTYLATSPPAPQRKRAIDALCREDAKSAACASP